jgi:thymidylate synthase (FAD)
VSKITVELIDNMGSDLTVVNAARVSFGNRSKSLEKRDQNLISYLANHKHTSPFGHCFATFHVKAPVFVARQLVKHKFLRWNEISRRYVDTDPEFYVPELWRGRSVDKKQGSDGVVYPFNGSENDFVNYTALRVYKELLDEGVAPEQARMVLPQSTMTEWWWSGSLDAFMDMCILRCKHDTQYETRRVAIRINSLLEEKYPTSVRAIWNAA